MPGQVSISITLPAAADLTAKRYFLGKVTATGFNVCDTLGELVDGVIGISNSTTSTSVEMGPIVMVRAGAAFAAGAKLTTNASGKAITSAGTHVAFAKALEAASAVDDEVRVLITGPVVT